MEDIGFDNVPTKILDEEIARRQAVIAVRRKRAESLVEATAKEFGIFPIFGLSHFDSWLLKGMLSVFTLLFGLIGGIVFSMPIPTHNTGGGIICWTIFFLGLVWFLVIKKQNWLLGVEFRRRHPDEAELLRYMK